MVLIKVRGVDIQFPYEPYSIQVEYMSKVIESLQTKSNALLESPTGTGKTLCLLCASLAWLQHHQRLHPPMAPQMPQNGQDFGGASRKASSANIRSTETPRIIYASRTHSQLAQVMNELRKTAYSWTKVSILGSRDQLCINPDVTRLPSNAAKNRVCRDKIKVRTCSYNNNLDEKMDQLSLQPVADIEELVGFGKRHRVCPFFLSKASEKQADLIFMPYNYIFDPAVRRTVKLDLMNAVVILDEGHNVGKVCEESYSYEITSVDLAVCIREIGRILTVMVRKGDSPTANAQAAQLSSQLSRNMSTEPMSAPATVGEVAELKRALLDFEKVFEAVPLSDSPDAGTVSPLSFLTQLFGSAGIQQSKYGQLWLTLENLIRETAEKDDQQSGSVGSHLVAPIQKFMELLAVAFGEDARTNHQYFRVYMRNEDVHKKARDGWNTDAVTTKLSRILSVWCLSPGCTMKTIAASGIHVMIITSGTLSPMEPLLKELMIPFNIQLSNPHIIKTNQVWMGVIGKGPDSIEWSSAYKNKDSLEYRRSLGRGILNLLDAIPDGVLVFFSSYRTLQDCVETWKQEGLWEAMNKKKTCFIEPTNRNEFATALAEYFRIVKEGQKGAVFFGVCRGKISEGVDFPDCCARAVILTGLPYPARMEPRIRVKMEYLDQAFRNVETKTLTSQDWYNREAWSAVNQALGRVIRHASDYGACILCDVRFEYDATKRQLSGWLRNLSRNYAFPVAKRSLNEFFGSHTGAPWPRASSSSTSSLSVDQDITFLPSQAKPRPKRQLSPESTCQSSCNSDSSQCRAKPGFDDSALDIYAGNRPLPSIPPGSSQKSQATSVFAAMKAKDLTPEVRLRVQAKPVFIDSTMLISSTFTPSRTQPKIRIKDAPIFHLDTEPDDQSSQAVPGVPVGFVRVLTPEPTRLNSLPAAASTDIKGRPKIADAIAMMKRDLAETDFSRLSRILSDLRKPTTVNCSALTGALKGLSDERSARKIALLLSHFIPAHFREEYDLFLAVTGILVCVE